MDERSQGGTFSSFPRTWESSLAPTAAGKSLHPEVFPPSPEDRLQKFAFWIPPPRRAGMTPGRTCERGVAGEHQIYPLRTFDCLAGAGGVSGARIRHTLIRGILPVRWNGKSVGTLHGGGG